MIPSRKAAAHEAQMLLVDTLALRPGIGAIKRALDAYLRVVEGEFHAVDFLRRLWREHQARGERPDIDLRCLGALWRTLKASGVITVVRYAPDGGNPYTNHHSAVRPVYRVIDLQTLDELDWKNQ